MPTFNLLLSDSTTVINSDNFPKGQPTVLIFFSPDCEHCQQETEALLKQIDGVKDTRFYFVTIDSIAQMKVFKDYYKLSQYPNITVGKDYSYSFLRFYRIKHTPTIIIYDKSKHQKMYFDGMYPIDTIIQAIKKL
jgi:thiol-disulfide isomerase/thioredoxin